LLFEHFERVAEGARLRFQVVDSSRWKRCGRRVVGHGREDSSSTTAWNDASNRSLRHCPDSVPGGFPIGRALAVAYVAPMRPYHLFCAHCRQRIEMAHLVNGTSLVICLCSCGVQMTVTLRPEHLSQRPPTDSDRNPPTDTDLHE
jgi:hypothetical protein